jgi:toxin secretion/phage lysis holin
MIIASFIIEKSEGEIMREIWNIVQMIFAAVGGWLGYFLGGYDGFLYALIVFVVIDYLLGVMCAVIEKHLSSDIGAKGIFKKVVIFSLVGVAHIVDQNIIGDGGAIRTAVIFFYLSNEGISIIENATRLGLPVPEKFKDILEQLKDGGDKDGTK